MQVLRSIRSILQHPRAPQALTLLFIVIGVLRLASTWTIFSQTVDEPAHIACGVEWLSEHSYTYEPQHPPLARIFTALGPWLAGARYTGEPNLWAEGNGILYHNGLEKTLSLARAGTAAFYGMACWFVFLWGRWALGEWGGAIAAALLSLLPPILGHGGLATTDMALTATLFLALYCWCRFLEAPSNAGAAKLGGAVALAVVSKFTAIPFFAAGGAMIGLWFFLSHTKPQSRHTFRIWLLAAAVFVTSIWATYQFSLDDIGVLVSPAGQLESPPDSLVARIQFLLPGVPVPARELIWGLDQAKFHADSGHLAYLFGELRTDGWWYFFPVVLAVKTPLPLLFLAALGMLLSVGKSWRVSVAGLVALAILGGAMTAHVNLGVRHVLAVYPLLALMAAFAVQRLWRWNRLLPVLPLLWLLVNSIQAHPDYLAWFNELAGSHPERILADSDLDWGQDLTRLRNTMRGLSNPPLSLAYFGTADPYREGLTNFRRITPGETAHGWTAVSLHKLVFAPESYRWLDGAPYKMVGRSIRLYNVP